MTIDEAIKHCEEVAADLESYQNQEGFSSFNVKRCECAADHRQLAEWLRELKEYKDHDNDSCEQHMELIYDDKTGTWVEAPEVYGTINCLTKEDYEYAKKAIKAYKELEAKHWDECRQIAHYDDELRRAKELLKAAVEAMKGLADAERVEHVDEICCGYCDYDSPITECGEMLYECPGCDKNDCFKWKHEAEALKLIGGAENVH